jgi:hypothetical protein
MDNITEGDFVTGDTLDGIITGRVEHIMNEGGTLGTPGEEYALESMPPENPAMSVRVYEDEGGEWMPTPYSIGMMYQDAKKVEVNVMIMNDMAKADINLTPTSGMKSAAARALAWHKEGKRGGTGVGLARANQIVNGENLSESTVARMYSFFSRHEVDKRATGFSSGEEGFPSPGRVAWDLWGGDAGFSWSTSKWNSIKNRRENKTYHEDMNKSFWAGSAFELKK